MEQRVKRGDIYCADMPPGIGSEQNGERPVLVIQNNTGNKYSGTVIVAAITSRRKGKLPTHSAITAQHGLLRDSFVMLEQIRTIDKSRLTDFLGALDEDAMKRVDKALAVSLGLRCNTYNNVKDDGNE